MFAAIVLVAAAGLCASAGASVGASSGVRVTITSSRITFAPSYVPTGTVVFTVFNRTTGARDFGANDRRTGAIAAGGSTRLTLSLPASGKRTFSSVAAHSLPVKRRAPRLTAALYLFAPCVNPATTTVAVNIAGSPGGLTLSQTTVPCGTVTFAVTDVDAPGASLLVSTGVPPVAADTSQLAPGGTATLTVRFAAEGVVDCDAVENNSEGDAVVVGYGSLTLSP
ncbi:MAG: hypothetical protein ABR947_08910 [Solirubrobacteraceae bacterium]